MKKFILVLFALAISLQFGYAADFYYNGAGGNFTASAGDWYTDASLTVVQPGIPGASDDVFITVPGLLLDADQTFHSLVIEAFGDLIFDNGVTLTVSNSVLVDGVLDGTAGACSLITGINLTINSSPNIDFTMGSVNVGGNLTLNSGAGLNLTDATVNVAGGFIVNDAIVTFSSGSTVINSQPATTGTGTLIGYTSPMAVPVSPWVIVGVFALIAGMVVVRKRLQSV